MNANKEILNKLQKLADEYPELRFGQLLASANLVQFVQVNGEMYIKDNFYTSSEALLKRMENDNN